MVVVIADEEEPRNKTTPVRISHKYDMMVRINPNSVLGSDKTKLNNSRTKEDN